MFVSYDETKNRLSTADQARVIVTGNPIRPVFYKTDSKKGRDFLGLKETDSQKPLLLVLGGSSGARQINELVTIILIFCVRIFLLFIRQVLLILMTTGLHLLKKNTKALTSLINLSTRKCQMF